MISQIYQIVKCQMWWMVFRNWNRGFEILCFVHTSNTHICRYLTLSISRYFPVANLTRTRQAVIIEPLRPEKFYVKPFNATSLYVLSICEVREILGNNGEKETLDLPQIPGFAHLQRVNVKQNIGWILIRSFRVFLVQATTKVDKSILYYEYKIPRDLQI